MSRNPLIVAVDTADLGAAEDLARRLEGVAGMLKVGLELFCGEGPASITRLRPHAPVFLDLKLHDIPTTVRKAARVVGALGATYLTLHARSGPVMLRAGVEGLAEGAEGAGLPHPTALAVTILTSDGDAPPHILGHRVAAAVEAGCGGLVLAAADVREAKQLAPRLLTVVPGIRMASADPHDQARPATPRHAVDAGADLLVVGRTVTAAPDPAEAAQALVASLEHGG